MKGSKIMIPKIIHFCWFGGNPLPYEVKKCIASWRKFAPDYKIVKWDESNFDVNCHPFIKSAYEAKAWAFVSDYARLKIMFDHGGIYMDTDVELLKNIDFLLKNKAYVGVQQSYRLINTGLGFGSEKNNPVIKQMLKKYDNLVFSLDKKADLACPKFNTEVLEEMGYKYTDKVCRLNDITVYPCEFFDPLAPGNSENLMSCNTVSIHHYAASWYSFKAQWRRKLIRFIGEQRIMKIKKYLKK